MGSCPHGTCSPGGKDGPQRLPLYGVNEPESRGPLCFESPKQAGLERWEEPQTQTEPLCSSEKPQVPPLRGLSFPIPNVGVFVLPLSAHLPCHPLR